MSMIAEPMVSFNRESEERRADHSDRRAQAYRELMITAIRRYEASRSVLAELEVGSPPYPRDGEPAAKEQWDEWKHLEVVARMDLREMEDTLARLLSAAYNDLVPEALIDCEETEESIGQSVVYNGIAYALKDVIGNFTEGNLLRIELGRMAQLGAVGAEPSIRPATHPAQAEEGLGEDVSDLAEEIVRTLVSHHKAFLALVRRLDDGARTDDQENGLHWGRWSDVLCTAEMNAAKSLAHAVCAADRGFDMDLLGEPGATFPTRSIEFREGLVMIREDPTATKPGIVEVIYADRPAIGDQICD